MSSNDENDNDGNFSSDSYSPSLLGQNKKSCKIKKRKNRNTQVCQQDKQQFYVINQCTKEQAEQIQENNLQLLSENQTTKKETGNLSSEKMTNNLQEQQDVNKGYQVSDTKNELIYYPGETKNVYKNFANGFAQEARDLFEKYPEKFNLQIWKKFFKIIQQNKMKKQLLFAVLKTNVGKQIGTIFFANFRWARIFLNNNSTDVRKYFPFRLYMNKKAKVEQENPELLKL